MGISAVPTFELERGLAADGYDVIVGFDEVGRGSLAGPVMVGAAAFRAVDLDRAEQSVPQYLADSKMLTEHRREALYEPLRTWVDAYAIGAATNQEIDEWGIAHALGVAALRALDKAERALGVVEGGEARVGAILDGPNDYITKALGSFEAPLVPVPAHVVTQVKGDQRCRSVAAAAVLAKVTRDRLMVALAEENPDYARYGWAHNKGYGSQAHRAAIAEYGPSDLHRLSWKLT
ncbi:MAG: ribonuclease HII [Bifidobacterium castoris]|nr:ribonuclease HII [Bifidobacterium castoris]